MAQTPDLQPLPSIDLGKLQLSQDARKRVLATHAALREPVEIDSEQLQRWVLRFLRDRLAA